MRGLLGVQVSNEKQDAAAALEPVIRLAQERMAMVRLQFGDSATGPIADMEDAINSAKRYVAMLQATSAPSTTPQPEPRISAEALAFMRRSFVALLNNAAYSGPVETTWPQAMTAVLAAFDQAAQPAPEQPEEPSDAEMLDWMNQKLQEEEFWFDFNSWKITKLGLRTFVRAAMRAESEGR